MATKKPKGLGRGLDALLGEDAAVISNFGKAEPETGQPSTLKLTELRARKYQPPTRMDEGALNELADSIRTQGIMQPILVRPLTSKDAGQEWIIVGERCFRDASLADLLVGLVLVKVVEDKNAAVMESLESIQSEDLNPLEEAHGVRRLLDEFGLTHEQAA